MSNLWLGIGLVSLFSGFVIYYFVNKDSSLPGAVEEIEYNRSKFVLLLPALLLAAAPLLYFMWPSYLQQNQFQGVAEKTSKLKLTENSETEPMALQELLLGIRIQAFENPQNADLWFQLGQAYSNLQMREAAIAALQRGLRLSNNPDWMVATAQLLAAGDNPTEAEEAIFMLRQALDYSPEHQSGLLTLGFTYYKTGEVRAAIQVWQKLASLESLTPRSRSFIQQQIKEAETSLESEG